MAADFWAGYVSGAVGILVGNPLDLIKVRLQASPTISAQGTTPYAATARSSSRFTNPFTTASSLIRGAAAPILGYGALNALLFVTYNQSLALLSKSDMPASAPVRPSLISTFLAGTIGGLITVVVSAPTELIKCRAQLSATSASSYVIASSIVRAEGFRGLYHGGVVTAMRDSIGYGFYFWSYELGTRTLQNMKVQGFSDDNMEVAKVLLCGGIAGVVTWASVFPLDVIKTRVQTQAIPVYNPRSDGISAPLLNAESTCPSSRIGAWDMAKGAYRAEGLAVFFRGLGVCSIRAFVVNAVQWAVYEWALRTLRPV